MSKHHSFFSSTFDCKYIRHLQNWWDSSTNADLPGSAVNATILLGLNLAWEINQAQLADAQQTEYPGDSSAASQAPNANGTYNDLILLK